MLKLADKSQRVKSIDLKLWQVPFLTVKRQVQEQKESDEQRRVKAWRKSSQSLLETNTGREAGTGQGVTKVNW